MSLLISHDVAPRVCGCQHRYMWHSGSEFEIVVVTSSRVCHFHLHPPHLFLLLNPTTCPNPNLQLNVYPPRAQDPKGQSDGRHGAGKGHDGRDSPSGGGGETSSRGGCMKASGGGSG